MKLTLNPLKPQDFFNEFFWKNEVKNGDEFAKAVQIYAQNLATNQNQSEKAIVANVLKPFFQSLGFTAVSEKAQNAVSTQSAIDLVLEKDSEPLVIIEAKKHGSSDFISEFEANKKALQECILYYFRERENRNSSLKNIIITDFYSFYIFRASEFEELFYKNKELEKLYKNFTNPSSFYKGNTDEFYKDCEKILNSENFLNKLKNKSGSLFDENIESEAKPQIKALHFDIRNFDATKEQKSKAFYKSFSKDFLLGEFSYDPNKISKKFYDELLYILGLKEQQGGSLQPNGVAGSLYENIFARLSTPSFETAMQLIILWLNRILFLKLIETNLLNFNKNSVGVGLDDYKNLKFLNISKIPDFDTLHELFFNILAKPLSDLHRNGSKFAYLPYLNSSIFTKQEIEKTLEINQLENGVTIQIYAHTSLFDEKHKKLTGEMPFLQYLFEFLDSFDFGENHSDENKSDLISSAVLGQVFERLNGYKDGSFYTPSFITSYMCKESINKIVLERFAKEFDLNFDDLDIDKLENIIELKLQKSSDITALFTRLNAIINDIKICDPAVGSGYFLVSALNYIIALKSRLGILVDENGKLLKAKIKYENDELDIMYNDSTRFYYSRPKSADEAGQIIQKTLFNEKAGLIENCLFGVDINPNSCEIARLRLWIELLKSSYFTDLYEPDPLKQNALETLPNIDINIKCGNSLVSYFNLKNKISIPKIANRINIYKNLVNSYKQGKGDKTELLNEIRNLQTLFKNYCFTTSSHRDKIKKFKEQCEIYTKQYGDYLAKDNPKLKDYVSKSFFVDFDEDTAKKDYEKLLKLHKETFSLDNLNPFEWRFEFPEILDENGDFVGFDLIIANPPYMQVPKGVFSLKFFPYSEGKDKGKQNTYKVFIEQAYNLVKPQGEVALITQSSIMCDLSATYTRELLLTKTQIHEFVEFPKNISIFTNVIQGVCILRFENSKPNSQSEFKISIHNDPIKIKKLEFENVKQKDILRFFPANFEIPLIKQGEMKIINKLKTDNEILKNLLSGSLQGNINTIHLKRIESSEPTDYFIVKGANIHRYYLDDNFKFAKITDETTKLVSENKNFTVALVSQNITGTSDKFRIHSTIVLSKNTNFVFLDTANILYLQCATQAKYLLALLNSKILDWLFRKTSTNNHVNLYELVNLPIPQITPKNQILADEIINLVDKILKETDENERAKLSGEIDKLVYQIYDLTADEIALIENS